jgi:toxin ParE1/3/4
MSRVLLSPKAKADLDDIWNFTFARWGMAQAEKYVRDLWEVMKKPASDLANSMDIGDVRPGYKKVRAGSHIIFFKVIPDSIDVVRILHKSTSHQRPARLPYR